MADDDAQAGESDRLTVGGTARAETAVPTSRGVPQAAAWRTGLAAGARRARSYGSRLIEILCKRRSGPLANACRAATVLLFIVALLASMSYGVVLSGATAIRLEYKHALPSLGKAGSEVYSLEAVWANGNDTALCDNEVIGKYIDDGEERASFVPCTPFLHRRATDAAGKYLPFNALSGETTGTSWVELLYVNPLALATTSLGGFEKRLPSCRVVPGVTMVVPYDSHNYFDFMLRNLFFLNGYDLGSRPGTDDIDDFIGGGDDDEDDPSTVDALYLATSLSQLPADYVTVFRNFTTSGKLLGLEDLASAPSQALCFERLVPRAFDGYGIDTNAMYDGERCADVEQEDTALLTLTGRLRVVLGVDTPPSMLSLDNDDDGDEFDASFDDATDDGEGSSDEESDAADPVDATPSPAPSSSRFCCDLRLYFSNGTIVPPLSDRGGVDDLDRRVRRQRRLRWAPAATPAAATRKQTRKDKLRAAAASSGLLGRVLADDGAVSTCLSLSSVCTKERPLVIARHGAANARDITNEDAVVAELRARGATVTPVDFYLKTVHEQMRIATSACALVGSHGPSLTNLMFLTPTLEYLVTPGSPQPVSLELVAQLVLPPADDGDGGTSDEDLPVDDMVALRAALVGTGSAAPICSAVAPASIRLDVPALTKTAAAANAVAGDDIMDDGDDTDGESRVDDAEKAAAEAAGPLPPSCLRGGQPIDILQQLRIPLNGTHGNEDTDAQEVGEFLTENTGAAILTLSPPVIEVFPHLTEAEIWADGRDGGAAPPPQLAVYHNLACTAGRTYHRFIPAAAAPSQSGSALPPRLADRDITVDAKDLADTVITALMAAIDVQPAPSCSSP